MTKPLPPELRKTPNRKHSPIVAVSPSGKVAGYFDNPNQAIKLAGVNSGNLYQCLLHKKKTTNGFMWYYRDEHERIYQSNPDALKWEMDPNHTYVRPGAKKGTSIVKGKKMKLSPEALEQRRKSMAKAHQIMREKGIYKARALKRCIPVQCVETGQIFPSHKQLAALLEVNTSSIHQAVKDGTRCRGNHYIKYQPQ